MEDHCPVLAELVLSPVDVPHAASAVSPRNTDEMMRKKNRHNDLNVRHNRSTVRSRRSLPAIPFNSPLEKGEQPPKSPLTKGDAGGCLLGAPCFTQPTD